MQIWIFWLLIIAFTLQTIIASIESSIWLYSQPDRSSERAYLFLTQINSLWASQQLVNMIFFPLLNLRRFNGRKSSSKFTIRLAPYPLCMVRSQLVSFAIMAPASLRSGFAVVVRCALSCEGEAAATIRV
jgi:hypothetical protein